MFVDQDLFENDRARTLEPRIKELIKRFDREPRHFRHLLESLGSVVTSDVFDLKDERRFDGNIDHGSEPKEWFSRSFHKYIRFDEATQTALEQDETYREKTQQNQEARRARNERPERIYELRRYILGFYLERADKSQSEQVLDRLVTLHVPSQSTDSSPESSPQLSLSA